MAKKKKKIPGVNLGKFNIFDGLEEQEELPKNDGVPLHQRYLFEYGYERDRFADHMKDPEWVAKQDKSEVALCKYLWRMYEGGYYKVKGYYYDPSKDQTIPIWQVTGK